MENEENIIELYFLGQIEIERIMLAYDSGDLLVEIGSCLGLWLGLSVVGMYDTAAMLTEKGVLSLKMLYRKIVAGFTKTPVRMY